MALRTTSDRAPSARCSAVSFAAVMAALGLGLAIGLGLTVVLAGLRPAPALAAADQHRQLGAHVHGHGTLNIAFEGGRVTLELEAPGADILGFEHEAKTDADKATLEAVTTKLKDALALFKFPTAAGCKLVEAKVDLDPDDDSDDPAEGDKAAGGPGDHAAHGDHHDGGHDHGPYETVDAEYELSCTSPTAITTLDLDYFKAFADARSLTVNVVTPRAQSAFEVTRDKPVLDLGGLM